MNRFVPCSVAKRFDELFADNIYALFHNAIVLDPPREPLEHRPVKELWKQAFDEYDKKQTDKMNKLNLGSGI